MKCRRPWLKDGLAARRSAPFADLPERDAEDRLDGDREDGARVDGGVARGGAGRGRRPPDPDPSNAGILCSWRRNT